MMTAKPALACVDGSTYDASVCDHAAWFARRSDSPLKLLHVESRQDRERPGSIESRTSLLLESAKRHLGNYNLRAMKAESRAGSFPQIVHELSPSCDVIVLGKRGADAATTRMPFGASIGQILRETITPILLVSDSFLPLRRAVVFLDAHLDHRRTVDAIVARPGLAQLELNLMVLYREGEDPGPKLDWAQAQVSARSAELQPVSNPQVEAAAGAYLQTRNVDLVILSRELLLPSLTKPVRRPVQDSLWAWRLPVLVC